MRSGLRIFYFESFWAYGERYINIVGIRGGVERERVSSFVRLSDFYDFGSCGKFEVAAAGAGFI